MEERTILLNMKELDRITVIRQIEEGHITPSDGASALGISERHLRRLRHRFRTRGAGDLAHRLRGRPSNRRTPKASRKKALNLIREKYPDFGPTFAAEKLSGHGLELSRETVRKLMIEDGLWKPKRKKEVHRVRRERRERFGELVQMDGSHHDWFEGRGRRPVLIAMIDDATNEVIARFFPGESMEGLMGTLRVWLETYGRPQAVYADRHTLWVSHSGIPGEREDGDNTQMRRALRQLEIDFIPAHSPQAKGRVERLFGTLQDRLVKTMRLRGIDNIADANRFLVEEYLPWHNGKFRVEPLSKANAHRRLTRRFDLDLILSEQEQRTVQNDYTIQWRSRIFQIGKPALSGLRGGKVTVAVKADGKLAILFRGKKLKWEEINTSAHKSTLPHPTPGGGMKPEHPPADKNRKSWVPPPDHPWKQRIRNPG